MDEDLETLDRAALIDEVKRLRGCIAYRASLDTELAGASVHDFEFGEAPKET